MIQSKHQKGSMMIEVVAVVALLALLTPLLFRQIQRRTDEVDNVRIASVMREAKDILQRAIEDNVDELLDHTSGWGDNKCDAWPAGITKKVYDYATTSTVSKDNWPAGVTAYVCRHEVNGTDTRPVFYGVVRDTADGFASFMSAADIATMIGAEGGVCTAKDTATGVRQAWKLNVTGFNCTADENEVVALTSLVGSAGYGSGAIDVVSLEDFITKDGSMRAASAFAEEMFVDNFYAGDATANPCLVSPYDDTGDLDWTENCVPVFEVESYRDATHPGAVYIRQAKLVFNPNSGDKYEEPKESDPKTSLPSTANNVRRSDDDPTTYEGSDIKYAIDPTDVSVMKDIRLLSRGNAKLSELLPNFILKGVKQSSNAQLTKATVFDANFTCPPYHKKAVIVEGCTGGSLAWNANSFECTGGVVGCNVGMTNSDCQFRAYQYCVYNAN